MTGNIVHSYATAAAAVFLYMTAWFAIALARRRNDVADVAWGGGFALVAVLTLLMNRGTPDRGALMTSLTILWSLRLAIHIGMRHRGKPEDARYRAWRDAWGSTFFVRSFLQVFMLQGFLMLVVAAPIVVANADAGGSWRWTDALGVCVWCIGMLFESVSDVQLARFVGDPANKGRIMQSGLWRYSRHPNYFGEVVLWWGMWLISLPAGHVWLTILGPLCITTLILGVSGIPMLEAQMSSRPGYEEYRERVSVFIPLPQSR